MIVVLYLDQTIIFLETKGAFHRLQWMIILLHPGLQPDLQNLDFILKVGSSESRLLASARQTCRFLSMTTIRMIAEALFQALMSTSMVHIKDDSRQQLLMIILRLRGTMVQLHRMTTQITKY